MVPGPPPWPSPSAVASVQIPTAATATASSDGRSANDSPDSGLSFAPSTSAMMSPPQYKPAAPASHRKPRAEALECRRAPSHRLTAAASQASTPSTLMLGTPR